jgi:hypothetical protein
MGSRRLNEALQGKVYPQALTQPDRCLIAGQLEPRVDPWTYTDGSFWSGRPHSFSHLRVSALRISQAFSQSPE